MLKTSGQLLEQHERFVATEPRYTVVCTACDQDFQPLVRSPLWWKAHQRAKKGLLDVLYVSGEECGCVKRRVDPDAPFRVLGYDDMCVDFDIPFNTFVEAVTKYRELSRNGGYVVFIDGISEEVRHRIDFGPR